MLCTQLTHRGERVGKDMCARGVCAIRLVRENAHYSENEGRNATQEAGEKRKGAFQRLR